MCQVFTLRTHHHIKQTFLIALHHGHGWRQKGGHFTHQLLQQHCPGCEALAALNHSPSPGPHIGRRPANRGERLGTQYTLPQLRILQQAAHLPSWQIEGWLPRISVWATEGHWCIFRNHGYFCLLWARRQYFPWMESVMCTPTWSAYVPSERVVDFSWTTRSCIYFSSPWYAVTDCWEQLRWTRK